MFKIEEIAGSLIKQGRFKEAIPKFGDELDKALRNNCITYQEMRLLWTEFSTLCLTPDAEKALVLGNKMIVLAARIPDMLQPVSEDFNENAKASREVT